MAKLQRYISSGLSENSTRLFLQAGNRDVACVVSRKYGRFTGGF